MPISDTLIKAEEAVNGGVFRPLPLTVRFDAQLLAPHIDLAELRWLKELVCEEFYLDLIAEQNPLISNYNPDTPGGIVLKFPTNSDYEALWTDGYLGQFVAWAVYWEALPFIAIQTGSNGLFTNNAQFGQNAGIEGFKQMQTTVKSRLQLYNRYVLKYLCDNKELYPLFPSDKKCRDCICNDCGYAYSHKGNCTNHCHNDYCDCEDKNRFDNDLGVHIY